MSTSARIQTLRDEVLIKMQCAAKARAEGKHALAAQFELQRDARQLELGALIAGHAHGIE